jgi:hypothetical protein
MDSEIREEGVELRNKLVVEIDGKRLKDVSVWKIERYVIKLLRRITGLRKEIELLREDFSKLAVDREKLLQESEDRK